MLHSKNYVPCYLAMMLWGSGRSTQAWAPTGFSSSTTNLYAIPARMPSVVTQTMQEESQAATVNLWEHYEATGSKGNIVPTVWTTKKDASEFVKNEVDSVLFDCDGVVYRSEDPAPGAKRCINNLLAQGKQIFFVTNNAAASRQQLRDKLSKILGMEEGLTEDMMVGSGFSTAQYLKEKLLEKGSRLYVIGSEGLCEELRSAGFEVMDQVCEKPSMSRDELAAYTFDDKPIDAVVVGHDTELNFRKLCIANVALQWNPNSKLVATNLDAFDLVGVDGRHLPGNGGAVKYLEHTSGRSAINCGKPSKLLADLLDSLYGLDTSRALFVGDRLDTDIRFGIDAGMHAALVMTGVTTEQQMINLKDGSVEEPLPSFILPHIGWLA